MAKNSKKPKIAAMVAMKSFPMWKKTMRPLRDMVDMVFVRFDMNTGDIQMLQELESFFGDKLKAVGTATEGWKVPDWRQNGLDLGAHRVLAGDEVALRGEPGLLRWRASVLEHTGPSAVPDRET